MAAEFPASPPLEINGYSSVASPHPYYPTHIQIEGWTPNSWGVPALLGVFFGACIVLFAATYVFANYCKPNIRRGELLTVLWFVLSGAIHIIFEGYYAFNFTNLAAKQSLIGQMWKEYAFSDSRYLTQNSQVLCMESVTAVLWGPGCLLIAGLILGKHPLRYPMQALVSMGQLYGDTLYYATAAFDHIVSGVSYSRPEAFFFWFYFILMNSFWIIIPGYLIVQSTVETCRAFSILQQLENRRKTI